MGTGWPVSNDGGWGSGKGSGWVWDGGGGVMYGGKDYEEIEKQFSIESGDPSRNCVTSGPC